MKWIRGVGAAFLCLLAAASFAVNSRAESPVEYVNPLIDTHNSRWFYFSSACRPFGMVNLSPDTRTIGGWESGYLYDDREIRCFSHVHCWQLAGVPVMPTAGEFQGHLGMDAYKSSFSHDDEIVDPGYHKVVLQRYGIQAELTSTCRVGFHRYTFPSGDDNYVIFDTGAFLADGPMVSSRVERVSETELAGYSVMAPTPRRPKATHVHFVARFERPFEEFVAWRNGKLLETAGVVEGPDVGAAVRLKTNNSRPVLLKVGLSYTSVAGACRNLDAECRD